MGLETLTYPPIEQAVRRTNVDILTNYSRLAKADLNVRVKPIEITQRLITPLTQYLVNEAVVAARRKGDKAVKVFEAAARGLQEGKSVVIIPKLDDDGKVEGSYVGVVSPQSKNGNVDEDPNDFQLGSIETDLLLNTVFSSPTSFLEDANTYERLVRAWESDKRPVILFPQPPQNGHSDPV